MNPGREQSLPLQIAVSGATGTGAVAKAWTMVRWLRIIPIAETDTFDVTIKDSNGLIMLKRTTVLGTMAERIEMSLGIMASILIENASQDGTYRAIFDLH